MGLQGCADVHLLRRSQLEDVSPEFAARVIGLAQEYRAEKEAALKAAAEEEAARQRAVEQAAAERAEAQRKADEKAAADRAEAQRKADEKAATERAEAQQRAYQQAGTYLAAQQFHSQPGLAFGAATGASVLTQPPTYLPTGQAWPMNYRPAGQQPRAPIFHPLHDQAMPSSAPQQWQQHQQLPRPGQPPMGYQPLPQQAALHQLGYYLTPQAMGSLGAAQQNGLSVRPQLQNSMPTSSGQLQTQSNQPPIAALRPQLGASRHTEASTSGKKDSVSAERIRKWPGSENIQPGKVIRKFTILVSCKGQFFLT